MKQNGTSSPPHWPLLPGRGRLPTLALPALPLAATDEENVRRTIIWLLVLIAIILALFALVSFLKRKLTRQDPSAPAAGFTLGDLRRMHKQGQLTTEEFERAKARLLSGLNKEDPDPPK